jgi:hypothetical protein
MMAEIEEWAVKDKMLSIVGKELGEKGKGGAHVAGEEDFKDT